MNDPPAGWTRIENAVLERLPDIGLAAWAVYCVLRMRADEAGVCWPSVERIALDAGVTPRTARRSVRRLALLGLIRVEARRDAHGMKTANRYTVVSPIPHARADTSASTIGQKRPCRADKKDPADRTQAPGEQDPYKNKTHVNKTQRRNAAGEVPLPGVLDSEVFHPAWQTWLDYRRKRKLSLLPQTLTAQLESLALLGVDGACEEINTSIKNGWQSVCYQNGGSRNGNGKRERHADSGAHDPGRKVSAIT